MIVDNLNTIYLLLHTVKAEDSLFESRDTNCELFKNKRSLLLFVANRVGTDRPIDLEKIVKVDADHNVLTEYGLTFNVASMEFSLVEKEGVKEA